VYQIDVTNRQESLPVDPAALRQAVAAVLEGERVAQAEISLAIVSDREIHELNRRFLDHDEPTDVLSFPLEHAPGRFEGEIVVSAETALDRCQEFGWSATQELTLYVIHGVLHLVGYADKRAEDQRTMRDREQFYLRRLGLLPAVADGDSASQQSCSPTRQEGAKP
jgi:probable rRNA maturation factor